jgi:hypothetical protein
LARFFQKKTFRSLLATQCKAVELSLVALIVLLLGSSQQVMQGVLAKNDLIIVVLIMLGSGFALELTHFLYHSRLNMKAASPSANLIANQLLVFGIAYNSSSYGPIVGVSLLAGLVIGIFYALEACQGARPSRKGSEKEQQLKKQIGWRYIGNISQAEAPFTASTAELCKKVAPLDPGGARKRTKFIASEP